ncbi:radical SAM protein [Nocardia sp. NPDC047038]|uniref:radical SAM/SPASM domain-containing protein n=1 Tax=Nocardia sp. NPDC047038 TaxID=3154338 RepID=UPI0033BFE2E8
MSDGRFKIAEEVFVVDVDDGHLLYAPFEGVISRLTPQTAAELRSGQSSASRETLRYLHGLGLIVPADTPSPAPVGTWDESFAPTGVVYMVTAACNLRCTYCYADAGDHPVDLYNRRMALDAAKFVIDNAAASGAGTAYLNFHGGGEPTLDFDLIRTVVDWSREYARNEAGDLRVNASMVTNGLISDAKAQWIADNMDSVQVSHDGPAAIHDLQRPTVRGGTSYSRVREVIELFTGRVPDLMIKSTISRAAVGKMPEIARYLCSTFDLPRFHLGPVLGTGRGRSVVFGEPEAQEFVRGYYAAQEIADEYGRTIVVSGALATFPHVRRTFCGVTDPNFSLTSDGHISSCYEIMYDDDKRAPHAYYGRYNRETRTFDVDGNRIAKLRLHDVNKIPKCRNCFAKWQCAGDCQARWYNSHTGELENGPDVRCEINRTLIRDRLLSIVSVT